MGGKGELGYDCGDDPCGRPAPGAAECPGCASALVGAKTARVTIDARLGPGSPEPGERVGGAVVGNGGKAGWEDRGEGFDPGTGLALDEEEVVEAAACAACSASTDGGGWKLGPGRGRTLVGRYMRCWNCGGISAVCNESNVCPLAGPCGPLALDVGE